MGHVLSYWFCEKHLYFRGGRAGSGPRAVLSLDGSGFGVGSVLCGGRVPSSEKGGRLCLHVF